MLSTSEKNYLQISMEDLLYKYDYDYSSSAVEDIIDEWARQKAGFIEAFKKHPNYVEGKFMIAFDADYERGIDKKASNRFGNWILTEAARELHNTYPEAVSGNWHYGLNMQVYDFFNYLNTYAERCISGSSARYLSEVFKELKFHEGQKTSRVVNKICQYLGFNKVDGYNREFAKYADSLSPITIKRHTILSINPLDYLTMSFGNSWASCHTIDRDNKRGMPNSYSGCYSSGTVSYMLDGTSMVLYTVDASYEGNEYWNEPKINRQMFHYGEEKLVQSRLYPQDNDGDESVYVPYRNIVQDIIATIFDFPNLWTLSKGTDAICKYITDLGTNYPDYRYFRNVTLSRIKGSENNNSINVGAKPICVGCGERHWVRESIDCCHGYTCAHCGERMDEDDVCWIDGDAYCRDCCHYCECCGEYHRDDETYIEGYGYVCESCLERHFCYCDHCDEYVREDDMYWVECEQRYICGDCIDNYYSLCDDCGEYFPDEYMQEYDDYLTLCDECYNERIEQDQEDEDDDEEDTEAC